MLRIGRHCSLDEDDEDGSEADLEPVPEAYDEAGAQTEAGL